jgi:sugar lactone lactonase YvrE
MLGASRQRGWMLVLASLLLASVSAWAQNGIFGTVSVGTTSGSQSVTVTAQAAGAVSTVEVLTMGASGLDFADLPSSSTCPSATLTVAQQCTEVVTFAPVAPGVRLGAVVLLDSSRNVLGTAYLSGIGQGGLGVLVSGNLLPVAGDGYYKNAVIDNIPATQAELFFPSGVTVDGAGNLYIADTNHNRIRMVCGKKLIATIAGTACTTAGNITTIAGGDTGGYGGDSGLATSATLDLPSSLVQDGAGNLYIADTGNNVIRKITAATGVISTVAGNGTAAFGGDAAAATLGQLYKPQGVAVDASGNLYIADTDNQRIRRVDAATGIITTVAGNGTSGFGGDSLAATSSQSELNYPNAVAFDSLGNLYIADTLNNRIRKISSAGVLTTFAGNGAIGDAGDGGTATAAELDAPSGVVVDPAGNVYIADTQNNAIRKVSSSSGDISTIVKNAVGQYYDNGAFSPITIYGPIGLSLDSSANLYFADSLNMMVRELQSNFVAIDFKTSIRQGSTSSTTNQTVENDGNAPLNLTTPDISVDPTGLQGLVNAALDTTATTCPTSSNPFLPTTNATCVIGAILAPNLSLNFNGAATLALTANIYVGTAGDTVNSPLDIELVGTATALNSTTVVLTSSPNPSRFGQNVTFKATVTTGTGTLSGTVTLYNGAATLATGVALGTGGVATYITSALTVGSHTITAVYSGDTSHFSGTSDPLTQVVNEATATSLASSANPSVLGASVTFTATVTIPYGGGVALPLTDTVTFTDTTTGTTLCIVSLTLTGTTYKAACTTPSALPQGQNSIIATYSGNAPLYILSSSSATLTQDVQAPSAFTITSSLNPSHYGNPVLFTATVPTVGTVAATGIISILEAGQTQPIGTATLSGNPATGTFTISSLPVGTDVITATYPGDTNYGVGASNTINQVVNQATTSTAVSSIPNPGIAGGTEAITATVTVTQGVSTPTGAITFMGGTTSLGSATLTSTQSGTATATVSAKLALGNHPIVATYAGDTNDAGSSGSLALNVVQAATKTTVTTSGTPALVLSAVTLTATVASVGGGVPTGTVTFTDTFGGATTTLPCAGTLTVGATTATASCITTALAAGSHTITATYSGDANDVTSSGAITQVVGLIPTLTGLGSATTGTGINAQVVLVATVINYSTTIENASALPTPTGTVIFTSGTTTVGSAPLDATGVATLTPSSLPAGTSSIVATYSGDTYHSASSSAVATIDNPASAFTLAVTPSSVTMATTKNATVNVALTSISGFTDTIGLGCASLPAGVTCHFSAPSATLTANGTVNVTLTIDTNNPLGGGSSAMNRRPAGLDNRFVSLAGVFLPLSVFFGGVFWHFRKRFAGLMTMALVLLLGGATMLISSCGGFSQSSASPGTYVIQVTGTGDNSNISRYQNVTLVITAK